VSTTTYDSLINTGYSALFNDSDDGLFWMSAESRSVNGAVVVRDRDGSFAANVIKANSFNGTATSATQLLNARDFSIAGDATANPVSFNGTANVVLNATVTKINGIAPNSMNAPNSVVLRDENGDFAAGDITATTFIGALQTASQIVSTYNSGAPLSVLSTTKVTNLNVDQVDSIHASSTATANYLYPLDSTAKFPNTVLHTGSGNGLDADTVDGLHATNSYTKGTASVVARDTNGSFITNSITMNGQLSVAGNFVVISMTTAIEPDAIDLNDGDAYILPTDKSGLHWDNYSANDIVQWIEDDGVWRRTTPSTGSTITCLETGLRYTYNEAATPAAWEVSDGYRTTITGAPQSTNINYTMPSVAPTTKKYLVHHGDAKGTLEWQDLSSTESFDYEGVWVSYSAKSLNENKYDKFGAGTGKYATITVENGPIRIRVDGTLPTQSEGHLVYDGDMIYLDSNKDLKGFRAIATTNDNPGYLRVTYYNIA
jgi:hypothetical protein